MNEAQTQVAIIGAGPAGLLLGRLLQLHGIDNVIVERRDREYLLSRIRAGVLEQGTVDTLTAAGVGERLSREGLRQERVWFCWDRTRRSIPMVDETGRQLTTYGQQRVVEDLIIQRELDGLPILWDAEVSTIDDVENSPVVRFKVNGQSHTLRAAFVAGCDGYRGVSRSFIPDAAARTFVKEYPFAWFGIMAEASLPVAARGFAHHRNGLALAAARSATVSRMYLQVPRDFDVQSVSDDWIWNELQDRLADHTGDTVQPGRIMQKNAVALRAVVCEAMQHGKLALAGDAAHVVPPSGAKGMNLAVGDARVLAEALRRAILEGDNRLYADYTKLCLGRIWPTVHWSCQMAEALHVFPGQTEFDTRRQYETLHHWVETTTGQASFRRSMLGLPYPI
jgi:p-hydroxybenzoate 3-monooxygenase